MKAPILHITTRAEWEAARASGRYTAPSLAEEGFIHCSGPRQAVPVAEQFYKGREGLVLLVIDPARLEADLKWEPPSGGAPPAGVEKGDLFPHVYGPINLTAVVDIVDFPADPDGRFSLPSVVRT